MVEDYVEFFKKYLLKAYPLANENGIDSYLNICSRFDDSGENHHILPSSSFPEFLSFEINPWNKAKISYIDHCRAHLELAKATNDPKAWAGVSAVVNLRGTQSTREDADSVELKSILDEATENYRGELHHNTRTIRLSGPDNPRYGSKHSPEARAKMSAALKGLKRSDEARRNISNSKLGSRHQQTHARWNEEKSDLYRLWLESGKLKKVKFSHWLSINSKYNYTRNELQNLVKEFSEKGFIEPENKL
ncbi:hypothetical protein JNMOADIG_00064 [Aeromonas phage avDM5]|uniref:Nuclease associated modular domain-containing protein n=1 Tax=Aeromonas phage vB_AehM_DM2 TaxID=2973716 RepID=A0AA94YS35_9CAUD|nr:hypothetical protein JNMOADIG_00064 [Aeromonas phage avDM5]UYD60433.1 hypothetical protein NPHMPGLK_00098 [Aeromonas phage avDM2]UYD60731.1 hypothetical protein NHNEHLNL_00135 [Aeromonas phage avDM2]